MDIKTFEGGAISASVDVDGDIEIQIYPDNCSVYLTKSDVIKMALCMGIKPDDLKEI